MDRQFYNNNITLDSLTRERKTGYNSTFRVPKAALWLMEV